MVTPNLELLVPETEHAAPFLLRRVFDDRRAPSLCCWAVLPTTAARTIQHQIEHALYSEALQALNAAALDLGTITPPTRELDAPAHPHRQNHPPTA